jgi:hypothetical protein
VRRIAVDVEYETIAARWSDCLHCDISEGNSASRN